jgi:hypothetical protein
MAASLLLPGYSLNLHGGGARLVISGNIAIELNTTNTDFNEDFVVNSAGGTQNLTVPKGPFFRIRGSLHIAVTFDDSGISAPFALDGNFTFEQITLKDNDGDPLTPAPKAIRIGASDVNVTVLGVTLTDGQGGFVFMPNGIAGSMRVSVAAGDPGIATLGGDVLLEINTTGGAVDQTISVGNKNIHVLFTAQEGNVVRFAILNASISIPPFFELSGDFTIQTDGDMTLYGARYPAAVRSAMRTAIFGMAQLDCSLPTPLLV